MNITKDKVERKDGWRLWMNIDDKRERSMTAWEDFKVNQHIKKLLMRSASYGEYEGMLANGYTHEDACDSIITNIGMTAIQLNDGEVA